MVITAAVDAPALLDVTATRSAARRLERSEDEPFVSAWLAARWARRANNQGLGDDRLAELLRAGEGRTPIEQSLLDDLAALDQLAAGDTARALATWSAATTRYSIEDVIFGLANSLWPLRLEQARVALAAGRLEDGLRAARTFERMGGFVDQVAWLPVLSVSAQIGLAMGDTNLTENAYSDMLRVVRFAPAGEARSAQEDSITTLILQLRN